jgi:NUMOD3 motif-containing protein
MNYRWHYDRLIERACDRIIDGYTERHHVRPRCMGGGNERENLVRLTAEEHYVAHQLLIKIYPDIPYLVFATIMMAGRCSNNKVYGWLRRLANGHSVSTATQAGHVKTEAHRRNLSKARAGRTFAPHSEVTKRKMSLAHIGKLRSVAHRANLSAALRGKVKGPLDEATKAKLSAALKGKAKSLEHNRKVGDANRGKIRTAETRAKLSAAWDRRRLTPVSQETKYRMSAGHKRRFEKIKAARQAADQTLSWPIDSFAHGVDQSVRAYPHQIECATAQLTLS